jgi:type II secretory pathway pseudopilin PulG
VLLALAIAAIILSLAVPKTMSAVDEMRTATAARYLASRITGARLQALQRSTCVALRFEAVGNDYWFATHVDGNRNGVRTRDIANGSDWVLVAGDRLADRFPHERFGLTPGVPDLDGARMSDEGDGVRVGSPRILTLSPDGTATSGTLYIRGRQGQYAVRVLGATARTRVFRYDVGAGEWIAR